MAILNSLLVNGQSRFLGKVYAQDLEVSGTTSFQDISASSISTGTLTASSSITSTGDITTSGAIKTGITGLYINNKQAVFTGPSDSWLRINANKTFSSGVYLGSSLVRTDGELQVGLSGAYFKANSNGISATVGSINNLTVSGDLIVKGVLEAEEMRTNIQQAIGGSIYISPTFVATSNTSIVCSAVTATTVSFTITDTAAIVGLTYGGANWNNGSKIKFTGNVTANNITTNPPIIAFSSADGVLTANMNNASGKLAFTVNYPSANTYFKVATSNLTYENMSVMMYQIKSGSDYFPVGIYIKSYGGDNKNSYIDVYGGTTTVPNARLGLLNGLKDPDDVNSDLTINGSTVTGWGLMTSYGYFKGKLVSHSGQIGGWDIAGTSLSNGTLGSDGSMWLTTADVNTAVKFAGAASALATWRIGAGSKFGVTSDGTLYASNIQASGGKIGNFTISNGKLYSNNHSAFNTAVAGVYIADDYVSFGSGGVTYFKNDGTGKIGPWTLTSTTLYKGSATIGTSGNSNIYIGDNGLSLSDKFVYKTTDGTLSLNVSSLKISGADVITGSAVQTAIDQSVAALTELIKGAQTSATSKWLGTSQYISALTDGIQIKYWIPYAVGTDWVSYTPTNGSAENGVALKLTLSGGTATDFIPCFRDGTSRIRGQYGAGNTLILTYRENVTINGKTVAKGWWVDASHDSTRYTGVIKSGVTNIVAGNIIVGKSGVYKHLKLGQVFSISSPILYASSAITANSTDVTGLCGFTAGIFGVATTQDITLTQSNPVFIKGTLSGDNFTPVSTTPLTQAIPTAYDGYQYIYLGTAYNSTEINIEEKHPIYMYFGSKFMLMSEISKTYMYFDATNGLVLSQNEVTASTDLANAGGNVRLTNSGMGIYSNNTQLANYGDTVTIGKTGTSDRNVYIDTNGVNIRLGTTNISSFGTDMIIGRTDSTNRNILVDSDSGVSIRKGTTVLANYGDTITINHGTSGKQAITINSTDGVKFYKLDGTTQAAQLNADGLSITAGSISIGSTFSVTKAGVLSATSGTIAGWTIDGSRIYKDVPASSSASGKHFYIGMRSNPYDASQTEPHNLAFWVQHDDSFKFFVRSNGYLSAADANIAGTITARSGSIAGFHITSSANTDTSANSGHAYTNSLYRHSGDGTAYEYEVGIKGDAAENPSSASTQTGNLAFYIKRIAKGAQWSTAENIFYVTHGGKLYASDAEITGTVTAKSGTIGANATNKITIGTNTTNASIYSGMSTLGNTSSNGFYIGTDGIALGKGAFKVTSAGALTATSGNIAGWTITPSNGSTQGRIYKEVAAADSADGKNFYIGMRSDPYDPAQLNVTNGSPYNPVFWVRYDNVLKFYVRSNGYLKATDAEIVGKITANTGSIGGWTIEQTYLKYGTPGNANSAMISPAGTTVPATTTLGDAWVDLAGTSGDSWSLTIGSQFGVTKTGTLYSTYGSIAGWTIGNNGFTGRPIGLITTSKPYAGMSTGSTRYAFYAGETNGALGITPSAAQELSVTASNCTFGVDQDGTVFSIDRQNNIFASMSSGSFQTVYSAANSSAFMTYSTIGLTTGSSTISVVNLTAHELLFTKGGTETISVNGNTGNIVIGTRNHGYYLATTSSDTPYPAMFDNGNNLWIGASSTSGPHHKSGTYISAGYNASSSTGFPTIYVSVPNANNNGGSNYAVLHENNYTSYVTSAKNVENNVRRIITTTDTEAQYCSAIYTNTSNTLTVRGRWGGTSYVTKSMSNFGSDIRLKTNINNTEVKSGLDMINSIKLHSFDWTDHEEHQKIGFVADELEKLDPHFSIGGGYEEDGTMNVKSVDVFYMQGFIVKSIQEEDSKVSKLEKEVKALKKQIKELEARLS